MSSISNRHSLLANLFAAIDDAVVVVADDGVIVLFNAGAVQIFGYEPDEVLGQKLEVLLPAAARASHFRRIREFAAEGDATRRMGERGEIQGRRKDGTIFPAEATIVTIADQGRRYFAAVLRDITERRERRRRLTEEERKFNLLFNVSNQFCALLDGAGRVLEFNKTWLEFLGLDIGPLQDQPLPDLPFWDAASGARDKIAASTAAAIQGQFSVIEIDMVGANDVKKSILVSFKPVVVDGRVSYIILNGADVTSLQRANDALRQVSRRLARAQKIARMGYWDWKIVENELFWSDDVYAIFGLDRRAFGANYESFLSAVHPDDRRHVEDGVAAALRGEREYSIDHRIVLPTGEVRFVHEQAETIFDETGRPLRMDGIVQDITERKNQELSLRLAMQRSEAASRAKSSFLANMSHELRTPLNAVIGFSEVLEKLGGGRTAVPADRVAEYSGYILRAGRHLLSIISDILDLAKVETGKMDLNEGRHDVFALTRRTLQFVREQAARKSIGLGLVVPEDVLTMRMDERLITQAIINLLANAIKFTPPGGAVELRASVVAADGTVEICVADTGIGIAEENIQRVMQPFEQVASALTRQEEGAGLGLALVRDFVALHGGTFRLESELGRGTRAIIVLPADRVVPSTPVGPRAGRRVIG